MPLMPHHNHLCLTEGGLEIIISKLNRIKSAIELCVYAFSNFYRTAIKEIEKKFAGRICAEYFDFARNLPVENKKSDLTIELSIS